MAKNYEEISKKIAATNIRKYGDDFYRRIGKLGGVSPKRTGLRGFALMSPEKRRLAGIKGGSKSRKVRNG